MAEFPAMPLWTDAYLADTTHLTTIEHGTYLLLLMAMWRTSSKSLPADDAKLARYAKLTKAQWQRLKPTIIEFFDLNEETMTYTQGRLTDEANVVRQHSQLQSDRARRRWLKNKETSDAAAMPERCPHTHTHSKKESDGPSVHLSRGSRLPPDWEPSADQCGYAERLGLDPERAAADFRDYWCSVPGQRGIKLDWNRTWQTRCRELADRMARDRMRANGNGRHQQPQQKNWYGRRIMQRIAAEEQAAHGADPLGLEDTQQGRR